MIEILCKQGLNVCSPSTRQPLSTDILKLLFFFFSLLSTTSQYSFIL